jgi:YVTN family beta-propeller protein
MSEGGPRPVEQKGLKMTSKYLGILAGIVMCTAFVSPSVAQQKLRIVQSNSAGDNLHIIDATTNKVVGEIKGIEAPHGLTVSPDGSRIYISEEADDSVLVIDGKTLQVIKRIKLSGNPNLTDITPDGRWLYVAIAQSWTDTSEFPTIKAAKSGGVDVIDTQSLQNVKTISLTGGVHDLNVTPDGKFVIAGASRGAKPPANAMYVIDTKTNDLAWTLPMSPSPSPMAVTKKPDGSTDKIYAQLGGFNGFAVIDFATHAKTNQIKLPDVAPDKQVASGPPAASHGIAVTSDQKKLLVNSRLNSTLYVYALPDLTLLGSVALGGKGAGWLTLTPDDKTAYIANEHTNDVSVVDINGLKEVAIVKVGYAPARNATWATQ